MSLAIRDTGSWIPARLVPSCSRRKSGQEPPIAPVRARLLFERITSEWNPPYMSPDVFIFMKDLPRTSTDKIDYQALKKQFKA